VAGWAFVEAALFVVEPWLARGFYQFDPDLGFRVRPGALGSNRFGFNDRDYPLEKEIDTRRILFAGDSFSWSCGRDGNYAALLETEFEKRDGAHRVDVINAGFPMTWTAEQTVMLKKFGLQYRPDLVVLGFFCGNDVCDANPDLRRVVVHDAMFDASARDLRVLWGRPLLARSRLAAIVRQRWRVWSATWDTRATELRVPGNPLAMPVDRFLHVERVRLEFCNVSNLSRGILLDHYRSSFEAIRSMKRLLDRRGVGLVIALYPDEFQVNPKVLDEVIAHYNLDRADYDPALIQRVIGAYAESLGIPVIDLLDPFREAARSENLYWPRNTHWNKAGNRLAAEVLYRRLSELGLVSPRL
jgi:hypothetical protein